MPALSMQCAKEAHFPPAEGEEGYRGGNANIGTDAPRLCSIPETARCSPAAGEDAGHIAV